MEARFGSIPGVVRTRVGYTGGTKTAPMYHNLGDHTEAVQVDYDPEHLSYEALLDVFWKGHNPRKKAWSMQYRAAVFFHDKAQKNLAIKTRDRLAEAAREKIQTAVLPAVPFYLAEAYHQKYRLQQQADLVREFRGMYPDTKDFIDSTAATRVNSYLSGYGSVETLEKEIDTFGLSPKGSKQLLDMIRRSGLSVKSR